MRNPFLPRNEFVKYQKKIVFSLHKPNLKTIAEEQQLDKTLGWWNKQCVHCEGLKITLRRIGTYNIIHECFNSRCWARCDIYNVKNWVIDDEAKMDILENRVK